MGRPARMHRDGQNSEVLIGDRIGTMQYISYLEFATLLRCAGGDGMNRGIGTSLVTGEEDARFWIPTSRGRLCARAELF